MKYLLSAFMLLPGLALGATTVVEGVVSPRPTVAAINALAASTASVAGLNVSTAALRSDLTAETNARLLNQAEVAIATTSNAGAASANAAAISALGISTAANAAAIAGKANASEVAASTNSLRSDLSTETGDRIAADLAIGVSTSSLRSDLTTETNDRAAADVAIGASTDSLRTDLTSETNARVAADVAIGASTDSLRTDLTSETNARIAADNTIGASTAALESSKVNRAGDTMTGDLIMSQAEVTTRLDGNASYRAEAFGNTATPFFSGKKARGTEASPSQALSGDLTGCFAGAGMLDDFTFPLSRSRMCAFAGEDQTTTAQGHGLRFETVSNGSTGRSTTLLLNPNGTVGIGYPQGTVLGDKLNVSGAIIASGVIRSSSVIVTDVDGTGSSAYTPYIYHPTLSGASAGMFTRAALGSRASPLAVTNGIIISQWGSRAWDGSSFGNNQASIQLRTSQNWNGSAKGTDARIVLTPNDTTSQTTTFTFKHSGRMGLNDTNPTAGIHVNGVTAPGNPGVLVSGMSGAGYDVTGTSPTYSLAGGVANIGYASSPGDFASTSNAGDLVISNTNSGADIRLSPFDGRATYSGSGFVLKPKTLAELQSLTINSIGEIYFCTDCSPSKVVVATGTSSGNFADAAGGEFK